MKKLQKNEKNLLILPIFELFPSKNIENWFETLMFKRLANLFYVIKQKELGVLAQELDEISRNLVFASYLKTYKTLDYFYVLIKNGKFIGVISFDISSENLYFKQGKYLIFAQTGLVSNEISDFWFMMRNLRDLTNKIIKKEQPDFAIAYLKNISHNKRFLKQVEKEHNLKISLVYNLTYGAF